MACRSGKVVIASAGMQADMKTLQKMLVTRHVMYQHNHNRPMSVSAAAQLLSNTLYYKRFFPYYTFNLCAGLDEQGEWWQRRCRYGSEQALVQGQELKQEPGCRQYWPAWTEATDVSVPCLVYVSHDAQHQAASGQQCSDAQQEQKQQQRKGFLAVTVSTAAIVGTRTGSMGVSAAGRPACVGSMTCGPVPG